MLSQIKPNPDHSPNATATAHQSRHTLLDPSERAPNDWAYSTQGHATRRHRQPTTFQHTHQGTTRQNNVILADTAPSDTHRTAFDAAHSDGNAARMLFEHLKCFQGCSEQEHQDGHRDHIDTFERDEPHTRLSQVTAQDLLPAVLGRHNLLSQGDINHTKVTVDNSCNAFEGRKPLGEGRYSEPRSVCVHSSHPKRTEALSASVSFDVDSHSGWPLSTCAFRQGISAFGVPPRAQQMQSNRHVSSAPDTVGVFESDPHQFLALDKSTHLYVGNIKGFGANLYIYFPRIHNPSTLLTEAQTQFFVDRIWLPSLHASGPRDAACSYPSSYAAAEMRSTAKQTEGRVRNSQGYGSSSQLEYFIDPETCQSLWDNVLYTIDTAKASDPDFLQFAGAQLFFSAKGHKYDYRRGEISQALDNYNDALQATYNMDFVDCMIVDVGKEVTPSDSTPRSAFFRACCVKRATRELFATADSKCTAPSRCTCTYHHSGLRDLTNVTATPPKNSLLAEFGVLYVQWYSQIKQRSDTTKLYPFAGQSFDTLAQGKEAAESLTSVGKAPIDYDTIEKAWTHCKNRLHSECTGEFTDVPHPAREEFSFLYPAFTELCVVARTDQENTHRAAQDRSPPPPLTAPLWLIPTKEYLGFHWTVANHRCSYVEHVLASTAQRPDRDQALVLLLMIDMLRVLSQATNIPSRRPLWHHVTSDQDEGITEIGAGFSVTMLRYGFCWLTEVIDWTSRKFIKKYRPHILHTRGSFMARYQSRRPEVEQFDALLGCVQTCGSLLRAWQVPDFHKLVLDMLVSFVLRQFRTDVRGVIDNDVLPEWQGRLNDTNAPFVQATLASVYAEPFHLVGAAGRATKTTKDPNILLERFFGELDQTVDSPSRAHFHNRPYRQLAWAATQILRSSKFIPPPENFLGGSPFQTYLRTACLARHDILPHVSPNCTNLTELTKRTKLHSAQRQWITVSHLRFPAPFAICDEISPEPRWYTLGGSQPHQAACPHPYDQATPISLIEQLTAVARATHGDRHGHGGRLVEPQSSTTTA